MRSARLPLWSIGIVAAALALFVLPASAAAAPTPTTSASTANPEPFIGSDATVSITFSNTGGAGETGYGPFIDAYLNSDGADGAPSPDGLSLASAPTAGGATLSYTEIPCTGAAVDHPLLTTNGTPTQVPCPAGQTLVVIELPFGSFAVGQPALTVNLPVHVSDLADEAFPLDVDYRSGFRFGADPIDNPGSDPAILESFDTISLTPRLWHAHKSYLGNECETATGINYPRSYRIDIDVAPGQTIQNPTVSDDLPLTLGYVSASASAGGTVTEEPPANQPVTLLDRTVEATWSTISGTTAAIDASLTITVFVPYQTALGIEVLTGGADQVITNEASATGGWFPVDIRDSGHAVTTSTTDPSPGGNCANGADETEITAEALTIRKTHAITGDVAPAGASPGDTVTFTIAGNVSDYYALGNVVVTDDMSDGLRRTGAEPMLAVAGSGFILPSADFDAGSYTYAVDGAAPSEAHWSFDVSDELVARGQGPGNLLGGCIPPAGTATPGTCTPNDGATTFTITYQAQIQQDYDTEYDAGDVICGITIPVTGTPSLSAGDHVCNSSDATADVLDPATFADTGVDTADDTNDELVVVRGNITKTLYAINGVTPPPAGNVVHPGDVLTYRITQNVPSVSSEDKHIDDFLPSPVLDATEFGAGPTPVAAAVAGNAAPPAGTVRFHTNDTYAGFVDGVNVPAPTYSSDAPTNSMIVDFGSPTLTPSQPATIDYLYSVSVSTEPFADGLQLTNQVTVFAGNTAGESGSSSAFAQITLREPELVIRKGVAATDRPATPAATYAPNPRPTQFTQPLTTAPTVPFTGTITPASVAAASSPFDTNVDNLDANDVVRWVTTVRNDGGHPAVDVELCDTLPAAGMLAVGDVTNFQIHDGAGTALTWTGSVADYFDCAGAGGVTLNANIPGVDDGNPLNNAQAVVVVTYDLPVDADPSVVNTPMVNTAQITQYTNDAAGGDFVDPSDPPTDEASATVRMQPVVNKAIIASSAAHTTPDSTATIGERIQYRVRVLPREGTSENVVVTDVLDAGLRFADPATYVPVASATAAVSCVPTACAIVAPSIDAADGTLTWDLGDVTNTAEGQVDYVELTYWVVVVDVGSNVQGTTNVRNNATVTYDDCGGGGPEPACANARTAASVVEPAMTIAKTVNGAETDTSDAGDTDTWRIDVAVASGRPQAFDVRVGDTIPSELDKVASSLTIVGPGSPGTTYTCAAFDATAFGSCTETATTIALVWDQVLPGAAGAWYATYQTTLNAAGASAGEDIVNTADLDYRSLPDVATTQCATDPTCVEREYDASDPATLTVVTPTIDKTMISTSATHTTGTNVTIGEHLTYQVVIGVPEGTTPDLRMLDTLDAGLAFTSAADVSVAYATNIADIAGTSTPFVPASVLITNAAAGAAGSTLAIELGDVVNTDSDANVEGIVIRYVVGVVDAPSVVATDTAGNSVTTTYDDAGGAPQAGPSDVAPDVTVQEPTVTIAKEMEYGNLTGRVNIRLILTNPASPPASSITAFDIDVEDVLDADLDTDGSTTITCLPIACSATNVNGGTDTITATVAQLAPGQSTTIRFSVVPSGAYAPGSTIDNTADVDWTTLPGAAADDCDGGADCSERDYTDSDSATLPFNVISGHVWHDLNNDGVRDVGEPCIPGVTITANGTDQFGNAVGPVVTTTDPVGPTCGEYEFPPAVGGDYVITETQPAGFLDGLDSVGTLTPTPPSGNGTNPVSDRFEFTLPSNVSTVGVNYDFGELLPSSLAGRVWGEQDGGPENGVFDAGDDTLLSGVTVTLTGTDDLGAAVSRTQTTGLLGGYSFQNVRPGTYAIVETQPAAWANGGAVPGTGTTASGIQLGPNRIQGIDVLQDEDGVAFDFWEVVRVDLAITKQIVPTPPAGGVVGLNTSFTWRVLVTNNGPSDATNVVFVDNLRLRAQQYLTVTAVTPGPGVVCGPWTQAATQNLECTAAAIPAGSSVYVDLTTRVDGKPDLAPENLDNHVAITGVDQVDTDSSNDQDDDSVIVRGGDVGITKTGPVTQASVGDRVRWRLTVTNNGPGTDPAVRVVDTLPPRAALVSTTPSRGTCSASGVTGATITCDLGAMTAGQTETIDVVVIATEAGTYHNVAVVQPGGIDENAANNQDDHTVIVTVPGNGDCTVEGDGTITGTSGDDVICGGGGGDVICGGGGNDVIIGGGGNDIIGCPNSCASAAVILGGPGNDVIRAGRAKFVDGGTGNDTIVSTCSGSRTLCGRDGNDRIFGGPGADLIDGGAGRDSLFGRGGNDRIYGGTGNDVMNGGAGRDKLYGGSGNDREFGASGDDLIYGQNGHDRIDGGRGRDSVHGGNDNDAFYMRDGTPDRIIGARGRDTLFRDRGKDRWASVEVIR